MEKFAQQKDGWCAPASLQYALSKMGKRVSQKTLARKLKTTVMGGTDTRDIKKVLQKMGYITKEHQKKNPHKTLKTLTKTVKKGGTAIVDYLLGKDIKNDGHYSVLTGATKKKVSLWDPSPGVKRTVPTKKFIKSWKDVGPKGKTLSKWGIEIKKKK